MASSGRCVLIRGLSAEQTREFVIHIVQKHLKQGQLIVNADLVEVGPDGSAKWKVQLNSEEAAERLCTEVIQEEINDEKDQRRTVKYEKAQLHQGTGNWEFIKPNMSSQVPPCAVPYPHNAYTPYMQARPPMHARGVPPVQRHIYPNIAPVSSSPIPVSQYPIVGSAPSQIFPPRSHTNPDIQQARPRLNYANAGNQPQHSPLSPSQSYSGPRYTHTSPTGNQIGPGQLYQQTPIYSNQPTPINQHPQMYPAQCPAYSGNQNLQIGQNSDNFSQGNPYYNYPVRQTIPQHSPFRPNEQEVPIAQYQNQHRHPHLFGQGYPPYQYPNFGPIHPPGQFFPTNYLNQQPVFMHQESDNRSEHFESEDRQSHKSERTTEVKKRQTNSPKAEQTHVLEESTSNNSEEPETCVKVTGISGVSSKENLELYFENRRKSGGGDIEEIRYNEEDEEMFIQYVNASDAKNVVARKHRLEGCELFASTFVPPPYHGNKILLEGLKPATTRDCLFNFLEAKADCKPVDLCSHIENKSTVLVTMETDIDFEDLKKVCSKRKLEGAALCISRVPVSNCILVTGLSPKISSDSLEYYFENKKRSGGGPVEKVKLNEDKSAGFIYFEHYSDAEGVINKSHTLNNVRLKVELYQSCLGRPKCFIQQKTKMPTDFMLNEVSLQKMKFLKSSSARLKLEARLRDFHAIMKFPPEGNDSVTFQCMIEKSTVSSAGDVEDWQGNVTAAFNGFVEQIFVYDAIVMQDDWQSVTEQLKTVHIEHPEEVTIELKRESGTITVMGFQPVSEDLFKNIKTLIDEQKKTTELKKTITRETVTTLRSTECRMLILAGFPQKVIDMYTNLKCEIAEKTGTVTFEGIPNDIKDAKLKMYETKNKFGMKKFEITDDLCLRLYKTEQTKRYVSDVFRKRELRCLWELTDDTITVYSESEGTIDLCVKIVSRAVVTHKVVVKKESVAYLETNECRQNIEEIERRNDDKVLIEVRNDDGCVIVCSLEPFLEDVTCEVEEDIMKHASMHKNIACSRNKIVFIEGNSKVKLEDIKERLQTYRVRISLKPTGFIIHGTEEGIKKAEEHLRGLLESVKQKDRSFVKPSFATFIKTRSGMDELHSIENDLSCVISVKGEDDDDSRGKKNQATDDGQGMIVYAACRLQEEIDIQATLCDITKLEVSVLVNNTDEKLSMSYGLGKIIAMKGGREVRDTCSQYIRKHGKLRECEVFASPAGKLKADNILHVTIPSWQRGHDARDKLETAVMNCLKKAVELNARSIAIPAIGCGNAKFPADTATDVIVTVVEKFFRKQEDNTLTNVILCDMKKGVVEEFTRALTDEFGRKKVKVSVDRESQPDTSHRKQRRREDSGSYDRKGIKSAKTEKRVLGNISVSLLKGAVARQKVDAIVNVVDKSLDLKRGTISATLLDIGGTELQQELKAKYPNGLEYGQVAITSGKKLTCRFVIHCRLGPWDGSNTETGVESLHTFMKICLNEAHQNKLESIVFPAIGTGKLGYPKHVAAKEIFASVASFSKDNQQSSIKEVRVVIYQDDHQTIKAFEEEICHWETGTRIGAREMRKFYPDHDIDDNKKMYKVGQLKLTIKQGDILEEDTDCIVNSIPYSMDLRKGAVSKRIYEKCGEDIAAELEKKKEWMRRYDLVTTSAPNLSCACIIHVAVQENVAGWGKVVVKSLKRAEEKHMHRMALPALGTSYHIQPKKMADCIIAAIVDFEKTNPQYLEEVRLVIFKSEMLHAFHSSASDISSGFQSHRHNRAEKDDPDKITFTILAMENDTIDRAARKIDKCYEQRDFKDDIIKSFNRHHSKQLDELASKENVLVNFDKSKGRIQLCGLAKNVREASERVHGIMREAVKFEKNKTSADLMSHMIQWFFTDTNGSTEKLVPYEKTVNFRIENAYTAKDQSVTFRDSKKVQYKIDFKQMKEYPVDKPTDAVIVVRKDTIKDASGSLPNTWAPMTGNFTVVALATTDQEYIDTEKAFKTSIGATINVVKIERVQNKALWNQYQAKKQQMEQQNPPNTKNESLLWHGSSVIGIDNIKVHGFDRGYSNMGCSIGVGVYFSPMASISRGYARADTAGIQKMFRCKVLTGEYCLGQSTIRVPPAKPAGGPHAKYDSVVNNMGTPVEFVIFNDTQAYPEYLIHFKP